MASLARFATTLTALFAASPLVLQGCSSSTADPNSSSGSALGARRANNVMWKKGPEEAALVRPDSAPSGAHLTYNGGRVNSATQAIVVLWGSGSYESHVTSTGTPSMLSFYNQVLSNGSYASWLNSEYNTVNNSYNGTKTNQNIGNGSASQVITITPSSSSTTVDDSTIQSELSAQISAGHLPAPTHDAAGNNTTYYAIFFPHGITITQGGSNSCQAGGFCAYHGTVSGGSQGEFYYGVHPDMQAGSGCDTGCGSASTAFGNYTSVASHELTEMITDAEVGIASNGNGPPLAWYDNTNGEIGDICNAQQGSYTACDGQTYVIQQEFSNAQNNCINYPAPSCGAPTADFSISDTPATIQAGSSGTSTVTTSVVGAAGTVSLAVSGAPSGVTASVSPTSVAAGGSATVSISVASTVAAGNYSLTVTGTEGSKTHSSTIALTVTTTPPPPPPSGGITNGGFETGSLSGWTASGAATAASTAAAHSGSYGARLGSTSPTNGDSSVTQTFTVPSGDTSLSFYYRNTCPDTVTYDWATATLKDNTSNTTTTILAKTCTAAGAWTQVTAAVTAGHSYTLTLTSHDDNYAGDPTYTDFDDVTLGGSAPPPPPPSGGVTNGGFETGSLSGWTASGASASVSTTAHSGSYSARLGSTSPTNGDSSVTQTFTAPSGTSTLSFYYANYCPDTVTYDWATATLKDNTAGTTKTVLAKTCTAAGSWTQVSTAVTAGHSYTLTLTSHDDNYAGDPTYTLYDDVTLH
jgi:hypothetical protein